MRTGIRVVAFCCHPATLTVLPQISPMMTQTQWDELYRKLYDAYASSILKDEYVRSTIADALDHMILFKQQKLIRN